MDRLFSTFSHPTTSKGDSGFLHNMVGESVSKIDGLVPSVVKQVSSEAISAAQGVASEVQHAGVLSSTASGIINQVSSDAISAVQGVATQVQPVGVLSTASGIINQVSSDAIGVATDLQPAGVLSSNASGFIKHVSSDAISAAQGMAAEVQPVGVLSTASGLIQQASSNAISAAQGVATKVQPVGVLNTASGFIKQVSTDAVSAAQDMANAVQPAGVLSTASGLIQQVSSDAISAAQGVATAVQPVGVLNTASGLIQQVSSDVISAAQGVATGASGFINQVSSEAIIAAQGVTTRVLHPEEDKEEAHRLKYLEFVQVAVVHVVLFFTNLYVYLKQRSGPLKPCIEIIEGMVKIVARLVFAKYSDVPFELLKFFDRKVGEVVTKIEALGVVEGADTQVQHVGLLSNASGLINQVSSEALLAAQKVPGVGGVATEIQRAQEIIEVIQRLRHWASVIISLFVHAKERLGVLKPVIEIIERLVKSVYKQVFEAMVKSLVRLVLEKYFGVPANLLDLVDGKVGESVTKIDALVPPVFKEVSSEALSAASGLALGMATELQPAAMVGTATGFINQISSGAISATQKAQTATDQVHPIGLLSDASGFIKHISSEATPTTHKAAEMVTEVKPVGVASTASGFIKQVASEAISIAQQAPTLPTKLQPTEVLSSASEILIKQVSSEAISASRVTTDVQPVATVNTVSGLIKQVTSEAISVAEDVATGIGVSTWRKLNKLPLVPQIASIVVPTAAYFTKKYNQTVVSSAEKGYKVASYLPLVPIEKIAKVFNEGKPKSQPLLFKRLFA
ncbi:hypothetical protein PTKIN_Ptkin06aG0211600 [Pterospermum kingtungense]